MQRECLRSSLALALIYAAETVLRRPSLLAERVFWRHPQDRKSLSGYFFRSGQLNDLCPKHKMCLGHSISVNIREDL